MKNVVVFGGGTGLSHLLSGLKLFPVNVTAVISVADSGSSTGVLRRELSIPAVGDIGKVMLTMFFDCFYIWLIRLPVAFILCYFTKLDVRIVFTLCWVTEMIKSFVGYILVNKGIWLKTMV